MDNQLFKLCKEVYRRTEWSHHDSWFDIDSDIPLYTSDYLLEKLPPVVVARGEAFSTATRMAMTSGQLVGTEAGTPLKALLKLTVALHEAGELK